MWWCGAGGDGGGSSFLGFKFSGSGARIDEKMLQYIADETGGRYFRAKDTGDLVRIYETINALEKTEAETQIFRNYEEKYQSYLLTSLIVGCLMILAGLVSHRRLA